MRVIAGTQKNRKLIGPKNLSIRPTSNKIKKLIFDYLGDKVSDSIILDLYSGTGNLGIEALSRGAAHVQFIEYDKKTAPIIYKNIKLTQFEVNSKIIIQEAIKYLKFLIKKETQFNIIFADPPYQYKHLNELIDLISRGNLLNDSGVLVLEHGSDKKLMLAAMNLKLDKTIILGDTAVSFLLKNDCES